MIAYSTSSQPIKLRTLFKSACFKGKGFPVMVTSDDTNRIIIQIDGRKHHEFLKEEVY